MFFYPSQPHLKTTLTLQNYIFSCYFEAGYPRLGQRFGNVNDAERLSYRNPRDIVTIECDYTFQMGRDCHALSHICKGGLC